MDGFLKELATAIAARGQDQLPLVLIGYALTAALIWVLKGRTWAFMYVAIIPFLNWTFGRPEIPLFDLTSAVAWTGVGKVVFNPLTIVTGLVFVVRDFVQREMGHRVLVLMALAIAWSFYYASPAIALASGGAFAISEAADWLLYTFTKYRLSTRIVLSSALAAPIDTTVFLFGADLAQQSHGLPAGTLFNAPNWVLFIVGKMIGATIVWWLVRQRENSGQIDPASA